MIPFERSLDCNLRKRKRENTEFKSHLKALHFSTEEFDSMISEENFDVCYCGMAEISDGRKWSRMRESGGWESWPIVCMVSLPSEQRRRFPQCAGEGSLFLPWTLGDHIMTSLWSISAISSHKRKEQRIRIYGRFGACCTTPSSSRTWLWRCLVRAFEKLFKFHLSDLEMSAFT